MIILNNPNRFFILLMFLRKIRTHSISIILKAALIPYQSMIHSIID